MEQDRIWSWMGAGGGFVDTADGGWWLFARVQVDVDVGPLGVRSVLVPLSLGYITRVRWCARARGELGKWENHNLRLHHRHRGTGVTSRAVCPCPKTASAYLF